MKKILLSGAFLLAICTVKAQETLQSVTDRGSNTINAITISSPLPDGAGLGFNSSSSILRWMLRLTNAETGSGNTGSDFSLINRNDDGSFLSMPLFIKRSNGNVGIGTANPRAVLDVAKNIPNGALGTVLGRLTEGDATGSGTFIGTQGYSTDIIGGKSFSLVHNFYGETNSAINFHRGGDRTGGFISFSTFSNIERMRIDQSGNVGIGTTVPNEKLAVNGKIRAKEIKVETANWPDYVFEEGYKVGTLEELESYIKTNKRLPEMPSAKEVEANGVELGEMLKLQQKKIEELTLHLIEKDKELTKNKEVVRSQNERLQKLEEKQEKLDTILKKLTEKNN